MIERWSSFPHASSSHSRLFSAGIQEERPAWTCRDAHALPRWSMGMRKGFFNSLPHAPCSSTPRCFHRNRQAQVLIVLFEHQSLIDHHPQKRCDFFLAEVRKPLDDLFERLVSFTEKINGP